MGHRDNEEERRKPLENAIPFLTPTIFDVVRVSPIRGAKLGCQRSRGERNESEGGKIIIPLVRGNGRQLPVTTFRPARPTRAMVNGEPAFFYNWRRPNYKNGKD